MTQESPTGRPPQERATSDPRGSTRRVEGPLEVYRPVLLGVTGCLRLPFPVVLVLPVGLLTEVRRHEVRPVERVVAEPVPVVLVPVADVVVVPGLPVRLVGPRRSARLRARGHPCLVSTHYQVRVCPVLHLGGIHSHISCLRQSDVSGNGFPVDLGSCIVWWEGPFRCHLSSSLCRSTWSIYGHVN